MECLKSKDFQLKCNSLNAAANLCEDPEARQVMLTGFLPAVLAMFQDSDDLMCASAAKVLRAIIVDHADNAMMALEQDVVSQVCTALLRRHTNVVVADHLSAIIAGLRMLHTVRFDVGIKFIFCVFLY